MFVELDVIDNNTMLHCYSDGRRVSSVTAGTRGRPRDDDIDGRILAVTLSHLSQNGYAGLSMVAVADDAGTTRQAIYRRWPSKADLATAAVASLAEAEVKTITDDPFTDLVAELEAFRVGVSRPDGLSMIGTMLIGSTDPALVAAFRRRVVHPRRARLRTVIQRAIDTGLLDADGDVEIAVSTLTGSWYAFALAGERPPREWARRVARQTWVALGGT